MLSFFSTEELYSNNVIDSAFLQAYNRLTPSAQQMVLSKNRHLQMFFDRKTVEDYDKLVFSGATIRVEKVFILEHKGDEKKCPLCEKKIVKCPVSIAIDRKTRGFMILACRSCKRLFSTDLGNSEKVLSQANVPYELIIEEVWKDGRN